MNQTLYYVETAGSTAQPAAILNCKASDSDQSASKRTIVIVLPVGHFAIPNICQSDISTSCLQRLAWLKIKDERCRGGALRSDSRFIPVQQSSAMRGRSRPGV